MQQTTTSHTAVSSSTIPAADDLRWPEALGTRRPTVDHFPRRLFLLWLALGVIGLLVLIAGILFLEQRANRQIIYLQNNQLRAIRADGGQDRALAVEGFENGSFAVPQWAHNGQTFATIDRLSNEMLIVPATGGEPQRIMSPFQSPAFIGDSWSSDNQYLTAITNDQGSSARLAIVAVAPGTSAIPDLAIDPFAPVMWNPTRNEMLVTTATEPTSPTLQIVAPDGTIRPFTPDDKHSVRFAGTWSPDGQQIAYVVPTENTTGATNDTRAGAIWIANSDGGSPREIIADGMNMAPIWSYENTLFFTRLVTQTNEYELYRVQTDGQALTRIGRSLPPGLVSAQSTAPVAWSPDRSKFFFQGITDQGATALYVVPADNSVVAVLYTSDDNVPLTARWSPTSRAVLIADPSSNDIVLAWTDSDRTTRFATGEFPSWQP